MPTLEAYIDLLKTFNEHTNVYSKKAYDRLPFHVQDSRFMAEMIGNRPAKVLDMGSGSGLPSIIIAICNPQNQVYAVESTQKKSRFLTWISSELGLTNYTVFQKDILELSHKPPFMADAVTAKAFAAPEKILFLSKRFAKPGTRVLIPVSAQQCEPFRGTSDFNIVLKAKDGQLFYYLDKTY
ncbi:MAG: 16S rRNA (guanine(527)-N(7))-methyltransferase RsmG [Candidatus Margulisiibacteriota bacterium]